MTKNKALIVTIKILAVVAVAAIYAFFFKVVIEGRGFLAMGVSGISIIISRSIGKAVGEHLTSIIYMICYICLNIPLFIFAFRKISKKFVFYTIIYVLTLSLVVGFVPASWSEALQFDKLDNLTAAILVGIMSGLSCSATLMVGGCAGGIDIISTYLTVKKGKGIGVYNLLFNSVVLAIGLTVASIPAIVYTLVYAFFSSIVLDRYYSRNKKILLEIVTTKKDEICEYLLQNSRHGCTILKAEGAYTHSDKYVVQIVISWFQLKTINKTIQEIDPNAFIMDLNIYDIKGKFYMPPIK